MPGNQRRVVKNEEQIQHNQDVLNRNRFQALHWKNQGTALVPASPDAQCFSI
jgi:hypothetical protein